MSAAATAAMVAATNALRISGTRVDAQTLLIELGASIGAAIVIWIVIFAWCDRS